MTADPVVLPYNTRSWGQTRILVAQQWGDTWLRLPMAGLGKNGFRVRRWTRACLPDEGTAVFRLPYGKIDTKLFSDDTFASEIGVPDLNGYEIRIQGQLSTGDWKTIWWGQCTAMLDSTFPGSDVPAGDIDYHCVDGFARLRRWYMDYHQVYWDGSVFRGNRHPGYNDLHFRGDRDATAADPHGLGFVAHTWPSVDAAVATQWTDQQAMEHALASSIPGLEAAGTNAATITAVQDRCPSFSLFGSTEWLQNHNVWHVPELHTVRKFMEEMFERARGRGLAFCDWEDDTDADPIGDLVPRITIRPPSKDDVVVDLPGSGTTTTLPGSDTAHTTKDLSVIGDHRLGADSQRTFQVTSVWDVEHTGVEMRSEFIEVLASLSMKDSSIEGRWLAGEMADLTAATHKERELNEARFDHVFRRYGLPKGWDLKAGDGTGDGTKRKRVDYRCDDDGLLINPADLPELDTSILLISFASRLPLYYGYDYTRLPVVTFHGDPPGDVDRLPMGIWLRVHDSPDDYINGAHRLGMSVARHEQDLQIRCSADQGGRYRKVGDRTASLSSTYNADQMVLLVGLQLPHRARVLLGENNDKTKRITIRGHHLWIAHPGAIVALDSATPENDGYAPKRIPMLGAFELLRDDRDRIAFEAAMAALWYLNRRRCATWTLHDTGWSDGWLGADDTGLEDPTQLNSWPQLGDLMNEVSYSGRTETLNTPVTRIDWDEETGATTWVTSWSDRDWK